MRFKPCISILGLDEVFLPYIAKKKIKTFPVMNKCCDKKKTGLNTVFSLVV